MAQEQAVGMPRQFFEVPFLIEPLHVVVEAVENDGDESERVASFVAISQRLGQEKSPETLPLKVCRDAKPRQNRDRQSSTRQSLCRINRKVAEIHLPRRERVVTRDPLAFVEQDLRHGKVLLLVLPSFRPQPVVDFRLSAAELPARVVLP